MPDPEAIEVTTSAIMSFAEKLEDDASKFYREIAERYKKNPETFQAFAKESANNRVLLTRTYQETITDALEAGFSFRLFSLGGYLVDTTLAEDARYTDALKVALELEENATRFYMDMAEQSRSLLATIPRAFNKVAENRGKRKLKLEMLLEASK